MAQPERQLTTDELIALAQQTRAKVEEATRNLDKISKELKRRLHDSEVHQSIKEMSELYDEPR